MGSIRIIKNGPLSTIQDAGRYGYQHMGMPAAGAMDMYALRAANILAGNDENAAVIEATLSGPEIAFNSDSVTAIAGSDMRPEINGCLIKMWTSYFVHSGDVLKLGGAVSGLRAYIAFSGGIDADNAMGSMSTYIKAGIGGMGGRKLMPGDIVNIKGNAKLPYTKLTLNNKFIPEYGKNINIRVVMGPDDNYFTEKGKNLFLSQTYTIGARSDRMGIFLEGEALELQNASTDIISAPVTMGSIQVSSNAMPIILMADRQTAGGYARIGTVISSDLYKLAQAGPGTRLNFTAVDVYKAQEIYKEREREISLMKDAYVQSGAIINSNTMNISINGQPNILLVEERG